MTAPPSAPPTTEPPMGPDIDPRRAPAPMPSEPARAALPAVPLDKLQVRQIIAEVDRVTAGRRRIDIAHALLNIVGQEIAANASTAAEAKSRGQLVAKQLKAFVRDKFAERRAANGGASGPD